MKVFILKSSQFKTHVQLPISPVKAFRLVSRGCQSSHGWQEISRSRRQKRPKANPGWAVESRWSSFYISEQLPFHIKHRLIPDLPFSPLPGFQGAAVPRFTVFCSPSEKNWEHFEKFAWWKRSQAVCAGVTAVTHSDRVVPTSRGHGLVVCGAGPANALPTGPAVVLRHGWSERFGALVALGDVLVWHPVVWPSHVLHETWSGRANGEEWV